MPPGIIVRPCQLQECAAVLAAWKEAEAVTTTTDTPEALARLVTECPQALLVAEIDGRIVGTVIAAWDGWRGNLYRLAVVPAYRRRGVARTLVREAQRRLKERGARRISLYVMQDDVEALAFWDALHDLGYCRDPTKMRFVLGTQPA